MENTQATAEETTAPAAERHPEVQTRAGRVRGRHTPRMKRGEA